MIIIDFGEFFNKIGNSLNSTLYNLDKSIHNEIKNTSLDDFIHDLKDYLFKSDAIYKLSKLSDDTVLEINEIEKNYVQCYLNYVEYPVPNEMVCTSELKEEDVGFVRIAIARRWSLSCRESKKRKHLKVLSINIIDCFLYAPSKL